jgi:phosphoserine phosphatase RsbU/P
MSQATGATGSLRPESSNAGERPLLVLVADDQADVLLALRLALKGEGFEIESADSPAAIVAAVTRRRFDVVLMDLNYTRDTTSGAEGLDLLPRLAEIDRGLSVVVMTAWGTIDLAVEAMRRGARDFLLKPWDNAALVKTVRTQAEARRAAAAAEASHDHEARDLTIARRVQTRLLPQALPRLGTLECAAICVEAGAVGGDGYDFLDLGHGRVALVLADASGKGMPAALLWANLQATLRSQALRAAEDLPGLLCAVNRLFCASTAPEHFATLFVGVYDDLTRRLRYVNCGHNPPFVVRAGGAIDRLPPSAPVVGLLEDWEGLEAEVPIGKGDTLLVYSDGVTEARNAAGEEFGDARLAAALQAARPVAVADLPATLVREVEAFAGAVHEDDVTLVAARGR